MTTVAYANALGQLRGEPKKLTGGKRRRLSAVMAQNPPPPGQRFIVSVHRRGETVIRPNDRNVRLRAHWRKSLVGPNDIVLVTVTPGKGGVASIGLAIASVALLIVAPYAAPAIAAGIAGGVASAGAVAAVQAGLVIGGIALGYAAQASAAAKKKTDKSIYSVTGGGNVPKPGARKPLLYGRCWSAPPLSQKDFITYDGDTMVLTKRMTLGIGRFQVHKVQVGESNFWLEGGGIQAPFTSTAGPLGTTIEFLYQQPSTVAPGDAISSPSVGGQEMPRPDGNPGWTPWFRATPQGVVADAVQVSHSYPAIYRTSSQGRQVPAAAGVIYQQREIHPDTGEVIGPETTLWNADEGVTALTNTLLRRSGYLRFPKRGAYQVRAQNKWPDAVGFDQKNAASWDDMTAFKDDVRVRNNTTEIVMRIRAGKGMSITSFSDVWVEATRIIPVWNGNTWVEQPERKAIWSFADLVRSNYGLNLPNNFDVDRAEHYHNILNANDTFDGLLPEVSPFWEAASEVLLPLRADPIKIGPVHSFTRDESRNEPRHVISRRQIVQGSSSATYKTKVEGSDVIVEFNRDGDPRRPDEARYSYGPPSRTPKRYKVNGIRDGLHAQKHATWLAAVAVFRGAERRITTEWNGRLVTPGDHILSDVWYLKGQQVYGVESATGNTLTLDCDTNLSGEWGYGSIRKRDGREWGIIRMRGVGVRGLELNAADLVLLQNQTGLSLANALAKDTQDPTTVVLGELVELQKTFVARAAVPVNADQVQIEMVRDDPRVWQLLDEQVLGPLPVGEDSMAEPLVPQLRVLHARCQRVETGIVAVWGVTPVRGARTYEADISYDQGQSWEDLSPQSGASTGQAPMRQSDLPVTVRARAFGRTGLGGDWIETTFTTVAPIVNGNETEIVNLPPISYEGLAEDVRNRIKNALETAERGVETAEDALGKAGTALDRALESLDNDAANAAAIISESNVRITQDGAIATRIDGVVARTDTNAAAVISEQTARTSADGSLATRIDTVVARTETGIAAVTSEQTARVSADGALGQRIDTVTARTDAGLAAVTSEQTARVSADGVIGQRIDTVVARTDAALAGVTSEQTARVSADGVLAQRIDSVVARTDAALAGVTTETSARITADGALAQQITSVQAQTDRGTAFGRMTLQARSDVAGVQARFEVLLSTEVNGVLRGSGMMIDLLPNGSSAVRFDADKFYITAPGASGVPAFSFDAGSGTLRVPNLILTSGQASLPLRVDIGSYTLIAGAGTASDVYDANLNFTYTVTNPDFPALIELFGRITITGPQGTSLLGMRLMIDGVMSGYVMFNEQNVTISAGAGNNTFDFRASCIRYLGAGNHNIRIRYTYTSPGAGQVQIEELHLAGLQPKA